MDINKKRELTRTEIFLYSTSNFGISIINASILGFVLFFYLTEGLTGVRLLALAIGALVGTALMVGRVVDAFVNPVVGWLSDNTRWKRWGRRRPFVIVGIIPMTLSFILLFNPPDLSVDSLSKWVGGIPPYYILVCHNFCF
ncbi:MAG: MFS transporter [Candidatus Hodarchaeota archaeon]